MRLRQLDILRSVAILGVLLVHAPQTLPDLPGFLKTPLRHLQGAGWTGVDLFFVLSGFLISGLLFREHQKYGKIEIGRFFVRRGLKIYPPFFVFLAISVIFVPLSGRPIWGELILHEALFIQNYFPGIWVHTWSLAVEEHFYILLPIAVMVMARSSREICNNVFRIIPILFLFVAITCLAGRVITSFQLPNFKSHTHHFPTHLRFDSLLFGVLLSYFYHFKRNAILLVVNRNRVLGWGLSLLLLVPVLIEPSQVFFTRTFGYTLLYLGFGGVMMMSLTAKPAESRVANFVGKWAAKVGVYSYSIYLWHAFVLEIGMKQIENILGYSLGWGSYLLVYIVFSVGVGVLMARLVETPVLYLRDRFFPSRSNAIKRATPQLADQLG